MPFDAALVVALSIISALLVALLVVVAARRRAAKEEELRRAASSRGWTFESTSSRGSRVRRWRGTTDGVAWTIESVPRTTGKNTQETRRQITRWHTASGLGTVAPIFCMGVAPGKEVPSFDFAKGDGWIAQAAQKAVGFGLDKAIDMYFGEEAGRAVDAGTLHRVESETVPGFVVMAGDVSEAARVLFQGLKAALADVSVPGDHHSSVLLSKHGIALARMQQIDAADDLETLIKNGLRLRRATTFGRPS